MVILLPQRISSSQGTKSKDALTLAATLVSGDSPGKLTQGAPYFTLPATPDRRAISGCRIGAKLFVPSLLLAAETKA